MAHKLSFSGAIFMVEGHNSCQMHINRSKLGHQVSHIFAPQTPQRERDGNSRLERDQNTEIERDCN